jgi:hypothetical protein
MMPQVLDDPDLIRLLSSLKALAAVVESAAGLEKLAALLDAWKGEWLFEETVGAAVVFFYLSHTQELCSVLCGLFMFQ